MKLRKEYKSLDDTLRLLKTQVRDGLPYAVKNCPQFDSPEAIFYWLKRRTTYKHDPSGTELLQMLPTLLETNWHGLNGMGDCDCFTIAALTLLVANGFDDLYITLAGRSPFRPVHIYCGLIDDNKVYRVMDLTNRHYDTERKYPYKQDLWFRVY